MSYKTVLNNGEENTKWFRTFNMLKEISSKQVLNKCDKRCSNVCAARSFVIAK